MLPVSVYGADGVSRAALRPHPRQSNSPSSREQTGREASWLKQVRKVKRVGKSEKWVTRPRGGGGVKQYVEQKNENDWWEGKRSETRFKKT